MYVGLIESYYIYILLNLFCSIKKRGVERGKNLRVIVGIIIGAKIKIRKEVVIGKVGKNEENIVLF